MTEIDDDTMLTLGDAARRMFPSGGVTEKTLKLRIRQGRLKAYRVGRAYHTTMRDMREMANLCEVKTYQSPHRIAKQSNKEIASAALDAELAKFKKPRKPKR